jgi:hypothetical protein
MGGFNHAKPPVSRSGQAQRNSPQFFAPSLLCETYFFLFLLAKAQRRKEIVVRSV